MSEGADRYARQKSLPGVGELGQARIGRLQVHIPNGPAAAVELAPFKDELFAYPAVLASSDNGDHITVDYQELRDINERDEVPERRAKRKYVSLGVRDVQQDVALRADVGEVRHIVVGKTAGAKFITLYIYGQGGSSKQGMDDFTFGGNFNRIKNLMA